MEEAHLGEGTSGATELPWLQTLPRYKRALANGEIQCGFGLPCCIHLCAAVRGAEKTAKVS